MTRVDSQLKDPEYPSEVTNFGSILLRQFSLFSVIVMKIFEFPPDLPHQPRQRHPPQLQAVQVPAVRLRRLQCTVVEGAR